MIKEQIIEIVESEGVARPTAIKAVNAVINAIADSLKHGDTVYLRGLATFKVRLAPPKIARDINAGKTIIVPERKTVKLILSKEIKKALDSYEAL